MKKFEKRKNIKENSNLDAKKAINDDSLEQVSGGRLYTTIPEAPGIVFPGGHIDDQQVIMDVDWNQKMLSEIDSNVVVPIEDQAWLS